MQVKYVVSIYLFLSKHLFYISANVTLFVVKAKLKKLKQSTKSGSLNFSEVLAIEL